MNNDREEEQHQLMLIMYKGQKEEMRMYKGMRKGAVVTIANEQRIEKKSSLFKEEEQQQLANENEQITQNKNSSKCCK